MSLKSKISDFSYELNSKLCSKRDPGKKKSGFSKRKRIRLLFIVCGVAIPLLNLCVFWIPTNINSILMAFQVSTPAGMEFGFDYFKMLFNEFVNPFSEIRESLRNTVIFFCVDMFIKLPLCFMFSYFIYKKILGYKIFRYIFYLPAIISSVVLSSMFMYMLGPNGPLTRVWEYFSGDAPMFFADSDYALGSILVYCLWSGFGSSMIFYTAAMVRIPESVIEYGSLEGVGFLKEVWHIIIPLVWPTLSVFILMGFVDIFSSSGPILLFTSGEHGTYTLSFWIYAKTVGISGANQNYAAAVGLFFTLCGTPLALFVKWLLDRIETVEY